MVDRGISTLHEDGNADACVPQFSAHFGSLLVREQAVEDYDVEGMIGSGDCAPDPLVVAYGNDVQT